MKSVLSVPLVSLFLPKGYSVSAFSSAVPLTQHNKLHHQKKNALSSSTGTVRNFPLTAKTQSNTQLQALSATVSTAAVALLRGGATASILNLSREGYYLQTLATYGTVTALIMNAALRLYSSTKFPKRKDETKQQTDMVKYMNSLFTAITSLCIISGAFTAVLFNILGIYSKSALGMVNEEGYLAFRAATQVYAKWGFRSFLTTCVSFVGSFLLSLYARIKSEDDKLGRAVLIGSIIVASLGAYHIRQVLCLATEFIFTPEFIGKIAE
jgi:hypothetical protein